MLLVENGKSGIFNPFSKIMEVPPQYDSIETISNMPNYHIVELNDEYGIISKVNNIILEPYCIGIIEYNRYFNIETEHEWVLFDSNLEKIDFCHFEIFEKFNDYEIIKYQNMFGFGHTSKIIFPFLNESYRIISDNRIIVNYQGWFCLLDENLGFIINPSLYRDIEVIGDDFLKVKNNKYGVLTFDGIEILPMEFNNCEIINNNFIVRNNEFWKSFDLTGKELKS